MTVPAGTEEASPSTAAAAAGVLSGNIEASIQQAFFRIAASAPLRTAVVSGERRWSYGDLAGMAARISEGLRRRGVGPGARVGLYLERSPEAIAAILGILGAGAAYLPFDPSYPQALLRQIYRDGAPVLVVVDQAQESPRGGARFWDDAAVDLHADLLAGGAGDEVNRQHAGSGSDPAYVMYTSGSTGRPKGVTVPHRAVLRLVLDNNFAELGPDQVLLQLAPLAFDASTFEIWGALLNGGTLAILPGRNPFLDQIAQTIQQHGVTTLWLTAGLFNLMVDHKLAGLGPLRQLLAGGDVLSPIHVRKALRALPQCQIINGYGPTENTTFTCCYRIPGGLLPDGPIPIGKPIRHTEIHILDEARRPVAEGEAGELFVGGAGLADGYLNQPALTAEKFIADPFSLTPGARLYRTGDQVRRRPDGNLDFVGRTDRQVKINGKRVELDAVEACLRKSTLVADAAAISFVGASEQRQIAAFVVPKAESAPTVEALRGALRQELPDYMVPAVIELLAVLPLGPTGKIDRGRLHPAAKTPAPPSPFQTPLTEIENILLGLWRRALGSDSVQVTDNFFDLGGNSLQLVEIHALLQAALGKSIALLDLFEYPRIRALGARLIAQPLLEKSPLLTPADRARRRNAALNRIAAASGNSSS